MKDDKEITLNHEALVRIHAILHDLASVDLCDIDRDDLFDAIFAIDDAMTAIGFTPNFPDFE